MAAFSISDDFVEGFSASFAGEDILINGKSFPAGYLACAALEVPTTLLDKIDKAIQQFNSDLVIFLAAGTPSSSGNAQISMQKAWALLENLPGYEQTKRSNNNPANFISHLYNNPALFEDCTTPGTERYRYFQHFLKQLTEIPNNVRKFQSAARRFLSVYYQDFSEGGRNAEQYARAMMQMYEDRAVSYSAIYEDYDLEYPDENIYNLDTTTHQWLDWYDRQTQAVKDIFSMPEVFHLHVAYVAEYHPVKKSPVLAEKMIFHNLMDFYCTDFYHGMMVGHLPRRCQNCKKYFLLVDGFDTRYCTRIAPGQKKKTCKQVGAHTQKKIRDAESPVRQTYAKIYNRLKSRKRSGSLTVDEWNEKIAQLMDIRDSYDAGNLAEALALYQMEKIGEK